MNEIELHNRLLLLESKRRILKERLEDLKYEFSSSGTPAVLGKESSEIRAELVKVDNLLFDLCKLYAEDDG